jgi:molybdenum cofactor guanylyltransferase
MGLRDSAPCNSVHGFVLAGGQSLRMGTDKARVLFHGIPLVQMALNRFAEAGIPARIAGTRNGLGEFAVEIPDTLPDAGPMGGVHAALAASEAEWNVFVPVDMPLLPPSLLTCLLRRARLTGAPVTAVKRNGRLEPWPVVLGRGVVAGLERRLREGSTSCQQAWRTIPAEMGGPLDAADVEMLAQCGQCLHPAGLPAWLWFQSANCADELALLSRFGGSAAASGNLGV